MHEQIKDILLKHIGHKNPIKSKEISEKMGFPLEDTQSVSRKAIWETAEKFGLPLVSSSKGYYIAETDEEVEKYRDNIKQRIQGMESTLKMVIKNYKEQKK